MKKKNSLNLIRSSRFGCRAFWTVGCLLLSMCLSGHADLPVQLKFSQVTQTSDSSVGTTADKALDNNPSTFSLTDNLSASFWQAELGRPFEVDRIEIVNRLSPHDAEMEGLTLSLFNMDDQVTYETVLTNPGSGAVSMIDLPPGTFARQLRIGLSGADVNGAGNYQVGFNEVRLFGEPSIPICPPAFVSEETFAVSQTTTFGDYVEYAAVKAVDGDMGTFSATDSTTLNNYWIADLKEEKPIDTVELVNVGFSPERMDGLVVRILDENSNSVASVITTDPGSEATYTFTPPANTTGRYVTVGLEDGNQNGNNDSIVLLAEVRVWSDGVNWLGASIYTQPPAIPNLASFKRSYMLRLTDELAPASFVNDDDMSTESKTTIRTVDGYWEVDLGETLALYGVRAVSASDIGGRLTNTTCRLFDENHDSVFEKQLTGEAPSFDIDLEGPRFARYVRIGLEDKVHSTGPEGSREWYIGFSEIEVFGQATSEVGIQAFNASSTAVSSGHNVTLDWAVKDVMRLDIHPGIGSVGAATGTNGMGSIDQIMTNSTEFILLATNHAGAFVEAVGVEVDGEPLSIRISEVVADNKNSLEDGYGDSPDWIELRNTGNGTVDLTGWGLSDKASDPMKWVFPATNMAPHSTLIVFASKNDASIDPAGYLHADFKLDTDGDSVYLTKPDGVTAVDSLVDFPALDEDLAYGRNLEGDWTCIEPTPNAINLAESYEGWLESLDWSHKRGFYETNFTLSVTSENPEATILYSLDGSEPSIPYSSGLSITNTIAVRIQPVQSGYRSPPIQTKTFIFLDDVIASPLMDTSITQDATYAPRLKPGLMALPSISLVVPEAPEYDEQAASMEIIWPNNSGAIQENCGIYRYGGSWTDFDKRSFTLAFRTKYGNGKLSAPLFNGFDRGILAKTSFDKLQLHAGNHDENNRGFSMSDRFVQDSFLDMGSLNPHGRFVHVYLNGVYWGQYNCKEVLMENFMSDYLGGEEEDYVSVKGNDNIGSNFAIGAGDPPNPEPWELIRSLRDDYEAVRPYLDVSHFIDFMLLWGYGDSETEFRACGPKVAGSGYKFWINDPDGFLRTRAMGKDKIGGTEGPGYIWSALLGENHVDFKMLLADQIYKHYFNQGALTPEACDARLLARMDEVRDSIVLESARWSTLTPYRALTPTEWESKAADVRYNMFPYRTDELIAQWRSFGYLPSFDPPTFNQYGGAVLEGFLPVLTSSAGTIYYTLDGVDPRLAGGGISSEALVWGAGAVTITEDLTITTRVRASDGTWSALAEPRFLLGSRQSPMAGELVITEINYNPDGSDEYEFIEIWNRGTNLLDLSGVNVSNAVRYIFSDYSTLYPDTRIVIVEDGLAFSNRYQNAASPWFWDGIEVAGEWVGGLSDGGETISLQASDGSLISSVTYRSDGDWPERPNGGGSSLEIRDPESVPEEAAAQVSYLADGRNWMASSLYHGSPGRFDAGGVSVVINEVLAHTDVGVDWIEFYNSGAGPVDLSNMAITDSLDLPSRYLIPGGTSIDADGYLTVSAADLGFGFSELGSEAFLLELTATNIIRIVDHVSFPAVAREEPFGRYQRSDGRVDFTELAAITPGLANALPRVGPVVISEIMFAPDAGFSEYIEMMNISGVAVPLYDPVLSSNVWNVAGVGDFSFPEGVVLEPSESVILCATNPATFRAQYGVAASVQVFGPWSGGLANDGEKLQLLSPGNPEPDGTVPMYRADHVSYRTNNVWPNASGGGISLERSPLAAYGNDPGNWRAAQVFGSPGFATDYLDPFVASISSSSGGEPEITFPALYAQSYEIQYTDSLTYTDWQPLSSISFASSNWVVVIDPDDPVSSRYYRVVSLGFATDYQEPFTSTISSKVDEASEIIFPALYGQAYEVQYTDSLSSPNWQTLAEVPFASSSPVSMSDPAELVSNRFYRVIWDAP